MVGFVPGWGLLHDPSHVMLFYFIGTAERLIKPCVCCARRNYTDIGCNTQVHAPEKQSQTKHLAIIVYIPRALIPWENAFRKLAKTVGDNNKPTFTSHMGTYHYFCIPFGLMNAPVIFQRALDILLSGVRWRIGLVYINDGIVFSKTRKDTSTISNTSSPSWM